jgi:hypothetical protein
MSLEKKKKALEMAAVDLSKKQMELRIDEKLEEIERLKQNIIVQDAKIEELKLELEKL